ncbi:MAG: UvrD-helicase domain-containing protein [Pseudomonadota bacterium]|nr:UvrD-helicase domain-containing protein [Pseudomonadota bacterium]
MNISQEVSSAPHSQSMPNPLLDALNPEQRQAVEATQGPVLVLAGAGTGKTRVLTTRIAHILTSKLAWPGEILAVTFTNKAAREMAERVNQLSGGAQSLWMGTFHSIGARIIRRHAEKLGLTSSFTILDADDQIRLLKTLMGELHIDDKSMPPKLFSAIIQSWKDQGLTPVKVTSPQDLQQAGGQAIRVYRAYQERLKALNAVDFGDLILHMLTLFTVHQEVLEEYAKRFKYILVDEYQDTNVAQYLWLRLLASYHKNLCCVGDDDQSIYSWRGAEVGNILRFERDFPDAKVIRLECNYRSTPHILAAAGALIANNRGRLGKTLWTPIKEGDRLRLKSVWDEGEEARFVGEEVEDLQRAKINLKDMAILVRAGFQTRAFEERFLTMGIPYRVIGGLRFYERAEIRDAVAYLRIIASPDDSLAFERIINTPKRGIGQATMQQLHTTARSLNTSLYNATVHLLKSGEIKGKLASALNLFIGNCQRWRKQLESLTLSEVVDLVLEESGYRQMWQQEKTPEAAGRLENLKELSRAIGEFENINAFLEHVSLVTEAADANGNTDMISLMTLHAAKGLEFDVIFLPGWEEGLFPHQRALDESGNKGLEEERRLAYVGITRARRRLYISHAANRRIYNQWQSSIPSRFISEIPKDNIEQLPGGLAGTPRPSARNWKDEVAAILSGSHKREEPTLSRGTRIFHQKFGYGRIAAVSGDHLDIEFEKAGFKKVLADFVTLA